MAEEKTEVLVIDQKMIESTAKALPQKNDIYDEAMAIKVRSKPTYERAVWIKNVLGELIKSIHESFDPICESANRLHKLATSTRRKHLDSPERALNRIRGELDSYFREEERKRREKEAIARAEAERKAQEERDREIKELEEAGAPEEAEILAESPVLAPTVQIKNRLDSVAGVQHKQHWKAECTNLRLLVKAVADGKAPLDLIQVNQVQLNKLAVALKENMNIPGCRAWDAGVVV